ncbi:HalOD1 output domain-containing protein [Halorubrum cibi]|uniref:Halobacterial output domain-containing protein n=1 Tax=Halorubrum cibi TaxID=413815 RepID=A0A521C2Q2_9EURY|nr:HalOD1 output domain-containing protein [Halorubrum cibi]SMO53757.1 hypothetical protein SAMN06264867_103263 [Halorubrum cibi]
MGRVDKDICVTVSETVSDALDEPVDALPPLFDAIDTDGLASMVTNDRSHDVTVTFSYAGMRVLVRSDSTVYVDPLRTARSDSLDNCV